MLTASPSPRATPTSPPSSEYLNPSSHRRKVKSGSGSATASPIVKAHSTHVYSEAQSPPQFQPRNPTSGSPNFANASTQSFASSSNQTSSQWSPTDLRFCQPPPPLPPTVSFRSVSTQTSSDRPREEDQTKSQTTQRPQMVDAQTQYSPPSTDTDAGLKKTSQATGPAQPESGRPAPIPTPASAIARLQIHEPASSPPQPQSTSDSSLSASATHEKTRARPYDPVADAAMPAARPGSLTTTSQRRDAPPTPAKERDKQATATSTTATTNTKRNHSIADARPETFLNKELSTTVTQPEEDTSTPAKRARPEDAPAKIMPEDYSLATPRDLTLLISSMLMELIRYNDSLPLSSTSLTRFHSRAPPGISVHDYLLRLSTHATLSPPILLSMVYYIDKLCALYPAFTISSLTVHRFLITAATVASKGLSDSFWTNKTYARVGGVSVKELALLELEFLVRVQWRIVPRPEVLIDYYRSLVQRTSGYTLEGGDSGSTSCSGSAGESQTLEDDSTDSRVETDQ